jgi:hypothetical protein
MGTTLTAITDMGDTIVPTDTVVISFWCGNRLFQCNND